MFDWDEGDRFSFEDSERFEEDSLCSWMSEPESVCNNWRGWKKSQIYNNNNFNTNQINSKNKGISSLSSFFTLLSLSNFVSLFSYCLLLFFTLFIL
jgi:hypothetical protein